MPSTFDSKKHLSSLAALYRADEGACLNALIHAARLEPEARHRAAERAAHWIEEIRRTHKPSATVTDLLSRFGLTSQEGLALMCLAEALLRIPDRATADALIRDKLERNALGQGSGFRRAVVDQYDRLGLVAHGQNHSSRRSIDQRGRGFGPSGIPPRPARYPRSDPRRDAMDGRSVRDGRND